MNLKEQYKQRLQEARKPRSGEPDTRELDRRLEHVRSSFIGGYPRGEIHRDAVARYERLRGAINPNRPGDIDMALATNFGVPMGLAKAFLDLNKVEAAKLEEPARSRSTGDPRQERSYINARRGFADALADLSTFPTRSNPPGTIPAYIANLPAQAAHHTQAMAAWRYSPTGETEYYDPTRSPDNPRNLSPAAREIGNLRRGDLLGNVSREDLAKIFRLRQAHKEQRRSGGPRTGGVSLSESSLRDINKRWGNEMNLKEHYKRRLQEDLQTPARAEETDALVRDAEHKAALALALGNDAAAAAARAELIGARSLRGAERHDPKIVYGKGGKVVGKVVPTKGSAGARRPTR